MSGQTSSKRKDMILTVSILTIVVGLVAFNAFRFLGQSMMLKDKEILAIQGKDPENDSEKNIILSEEPVIINFWATWCSSCVTEIPEIVRAAKSVRVIGVLKPPLHKKTLLKIKEDYGMNYENILVDDSFVDEMMITAVPTTMLIKNRKVAHVKVGIISEEDIKEWLKN